MLECVWTRTYMHVQAGNVFAVARVWERGRCVPASGCTKVSAGELESPKSWRQERKKKRRKDARGGGARTGSGLHGESITKEIRPDDSESIG